MMSENKVDKDDTGLTESTSEKKTSSFSKTQLWLGIALTITILILVIFIPCPTASQYFVFRIIIALAAAGLTAVIPGIFNISLANGVTAGGAMAILAVVYFFDPASSVGEGKCANETFTLTIFVQGKGGLQISY